MKVLHGGNSNGTLDYYIWVRLVRTVCYDRWYKAPRRRTA